MGQFFSAWSFDPFIAFNLAAIAAIFLWAVGNVNARTPKAQWKKASTTCFLVGLGLLAVVYLGPLPAWSHTFFWVHMAQHLVVMMAAAPLIVLGSPIYLWFRVSSPRARREIVVPFLRSRVVKVLTNPIFTWLFFAGVLLATHFTPFYDWALQNHDADTFIEQPLFLIAALLYYWPVINCDLLPNPSRASHRLVSMSVMMIPEAVVGAVIYFSPVILYSVFARSQRPFGPDPLTDQKFAGALMWALVMVVEAFWMMWMATEFFKSEERRSHRVDAEIAAEIAAGGRT
jgi:putative copper resistance protein D